MPLAALLADLVVVLHCAYVGYVVIGQLLIWLGLVCRWRWVRSPWFRLTHLVAILIVAFEEVLDLTCPLTILESQLRTWANQPPAGHSFMGRLAHDLIYLDLPAWAFVVLHLGFAVLVLGTFVMAPPRVPAWVRGRAAAG